MKRAIAALIAILVIMSMPVCVWADSGLLDRLNPLSLTIQYEQRKQTEVNLGFFFADFLQKVCKKCLTKK